MNRMGNALNFDSLIGIHFMLNALRPTNPS